MVDYRKVRSWDIASGVDDESGKKLLHLRIWHSSVDSEDHKEKEKFDLLLGETNTETLIRLLTTELELLRSKSQYIILFTAHCFAAQKWFSC